ncbi:MAG: alpha-galactosidase [Clostridia bacterium]|nr:alpha-galactosidase [Clostridia bacterium]
MEIELKLTRSNGQTFSVIRDIERLSDAYMLGGVVFDVRETSVDGEYVIYFQPQSDAALRRFELIFEFDPAGALVYDAGVSTNSWARVLSADNPVRFSRNIFMAARTECEDPDKMFFLNLGFTSFEKFFTYFTYTPGRVSAVYDLEDRPVSAGTILRLESIMIDDTVSAGLFFGAVAESIALKQKIRTAPRVPFGWSSWSCHYGYTDAEKVLKQTEEFDSRFLRPLRKKCKEELFPVIQIDDWWQQGGSFACHWTPEQSKFPQGISAVSARISERGITPGLWYAPGLITASSDLFEDYKSRLYSDRAPVPSFSDVYPLDIGAPEVIKEITDFVRRAANEWGVKYFKLDFLDSLLYRQDADNSRVRYLRDYSVATYRALLKAIRRAAGADAFLLACGGTIGESAGVFDAIRVTPDVSWAGYPPDQFPGAWNIICANVRNMLYRSYYGGRVFCVDPDSVLLRDKLCEYGDDSVVLSENEAEFLAVACAFSGGSLLSGDELDKLPEERRRLFAQLLPPSGHGVEPVDFWEYPCCTHAYMRVPDKSVPTEIHVLYNYDEFSDNRVLKLTEPCIFIDALCGEVLASGRSFIDQELPGHTARAIICKQVTDHPAFLWADDNIYRGAFNTSDLFFGDSLIITSDAPEGTTLRVFVPYGSGSDVYVNERRLRLETLESVDCGEGRIYSVVL